MLDSVLINLYKSNSTNKIQIKISTKVQIFFLFQTNFTNRGFNVFEIFPTHNNL